MVLKMATALSISVGLCCSLYAAQPQLHLIGRVKTNMPASITQYVARFTNNNTGDFYYGNLATGKPYGNNMPTVLNREGKFGFFVIQPKFGIKHSVIITIGTNENKRVCEFEFDPTGPGVPNVEKIAKTAHTTCQYQFTYTPPYTETFVVNDSAL